MTPGTWRGLWKAVGCAALAFALTADAQTALPAIDLERLELNPSAQGSLLVHTGQVLGDGGYRLGVVGHYERDPLVAYIRNERAGAVVKDRLTLHVTGAYGLFNRLELGFQVPFVASQSSDDLSLVHVAAPAASGIGTPQVYARVSLLDEARGAPVGLVAGLGAGLPLGSAAALAREDGVAVTPHLSASRGFGMFLGSVDASFTYRPSIQLGRAQWGSQVGFGAAVSTRGEGLQGEVALRGAVPLSGMPPAMELLFGARLPIGSGLSAFALAGPGFGSAPGSPLYRALIGLSFGRVEAPAAAARADVCAEGQPHTPDQCPDLDDDGDGVANAQDRCAESSEDVDGFEDGDGCADPDNDGDGVADAADHCPKEKGTADRNGCPIADRDHDGIADADDQCVDQAGTAAKHGCPFVDDDHDGLEAAVDACPEEAGPPEARGCPVKDADADGVPDYKDNCATVKGDPKNAGCPRAERQYVVITREKLVITDKIYFATNKAKVLPRSFKLLQQLARIVKEHVEIPRVVIEGHTDDRGNAERNRKLSQARADAVRDYLVGQGVDPGRLQSVGFGPDHPAESNATAKGREANRRVEFTIVDGPPVQKEPPPTLDLIEPLVPAAQKDVEPPDALPEDDLISPLVPASGKKPAPKAPKKKNGKAEQPKTDTLDLIEPLVP